MYLRIMIQRTLLLAALWLLQACAAPEQAPKAELPDPSTLLDRLPGAWVHEDLGSGHMFEEYWTQSEGRKFEGLGVVRAGSDTIMIEHLQIQVTDTGTWYSARMASQNASDAVLFELTHYQDSLVFSNSGNDFPQRIAYIPTEEGMWHVHLDGSRNGERREEHLRFSPNRTKAQP